MKIEVRVWIAFGPKCLRWKFDMLSGPVARDLFSELIMFWVSSGVKGGVWLGLIFSFCYVAFDFSVEGVCRFVANF